MLSDDVSLADMALTGDALINHVEPLDHLLLRGVADAPAILLKTGELSYAEADRRVGLIATALRASGAKAGDRVATWLGKGWVAALMPLASVRAGLVHVPINPLLKRAQVAHILSDCGARLVITNSARAVSLDPQDIPGNCVVVNDTELAEFATAQGHGMGPTSADPRRLAAILYTSGSTGRPKGVMLSSVNLWLGAQSVAMYLGLATDDRLLGILPLSFDYGQNQLFSAWYSGASVAPFDYLTPREVVRAVDRYAATTLAGVPPLWVQLVETDWQPSTAAHIRRLTNSGGALTGSLVLRLRAIFPTADIVAMYGLTEAFRSTYLDPALIDQRPDCIGKAIPYAEILVVRPDGCATDPDEAGELVHCGPLVAQGYWRDTQRSAHRFRPAPAHSRYGGIAAWSGDTVKRDGGGYLTFVARDDEMIKSSGNRISPTEIEEAATNTRLVAEAVALGVPDAAVGQSIALVVRLARGVDVTTFDHDLRARLRTELPNFMQPRYILVRDELARNANGKLDRVGITAEAVQEIDGQ